MAYPNPILPTSRYCYQIPSRTAALLIILLTLLTHLYLLLHLTHLSSRLSTLSTSLYDSPHSIPTPTPLSLPLLLSLLSLARSYSLIGLISSLLGLSGILRKPVPSIPRPPSNPTSNAQQTAQGGPRLPASLTHLQYFATWLTCDVFVHLFSLFVIGIIAILSAASSDSDDVDGASGLGRKLSEGLCSSVEELGEFWDTAISSSPPSYPASGALEASTWRAGSAKTDVWRSEAVVAVVDGATGEGSRALVWSVAEMVLGLTGWDGRSLWEDCEDRFRALVRGVVLFLIIGIAVRMWFSRIVREWLESVQRTIYLQTPIAAGVTDGYGMAEARSSYGRCNGSGGSSRRARGRLLKNWGGCGLEDVPEEEEGEDEYGLGLDMRRRGSASTSSGMGKTRMTPRMSIDGPGLSIAERMEGMNMLDGEAEDEEEMWRRKEDAEMQRTRPMAYGGGGSSPSTATAAIRGQHSYAYGHGHVPGRIR